MTAVLDHYLMQLWTEVYQSNPSIFNVKLEETRHRELSPYHLLINPSAPHSASSITNTTFSNFDDSQSKLSDESNVICWVDFDNEDISKEKPSEEAKEICDQEVGDSYHPLYINPTPWVNGQCLLALFPDECLPQAVSTELLTLAMNIFRLSKNPFLRLGYDSLGANSDINHLHFNVLFTDRFGNLPVEKAERKLLIESSLQHKKPDEINMFNIGVRVFEVNYPAKCLLITPSVPIDESNVSDGTESVGSVTGMVVNNLIENNVPHSLFIAGDKLEVFIFPRNFQNEFGVGKGGFLDLAGVVCTHSEQFFGSADGGEVDRYLERLSADQATWDKTTDYITKLLAKLYN